MRCLKRGFLKIRECVSVQESKKHTERVSEGGREGEREREREGVREIK